MIDVVKRALPFLLTLIIGVFLGSLFKPAASTYAIPSYNNYSSSYGSYRRHGCPKERYKYKSEELRYVENSSPTILFKPLASYTETARQNEFEGTVRLLVEFRADGKIGDIDVLQGQPYGLTDEAKEAAREIRFKPAIRNGETVTVNKEVEFYFSLTKKF